MTQAFNLSQFANKVNTSGQASLTTAVTGTLPVANGGTNQTTYTDGQLLIGNTTGNTLTKSTLTAGAGVTITNGSGAITIAAAGGGFSNMQVFASPGTFTTPATTTRIKVTLCAGGGGGSPGTVPGAKSGGGAGGYAEGYYTVTASTPYSVTVGGGGGGGASGGTSSFGPLTSATGGGAGSGFTGGSGGTGTGTFTVSGQAGSSVGAPSTGNGGASFLTNNISTRQLMVADAFGFGAGGSGNPPVGIAGLAGVVIVEF